MTVRIWIVMHTKEGQTLLHGRYDRGKTLEVTERFFTMPIEKVEWKAVRKWSFGPFAHLVVAVEGRGMTREMLTEQNTWIRITKNTPALAIEFVLN